MKFRLATMLSTLLLLAACAQMPAPATTQDPVPSGVSDPGPSAPVLATGTASVKIFIPALTTSSLKKQDLSAATTAVRLRVGTVDRTFPVGADQPGCAAVTGGVSCTFTLTVPAGAQTLQIDALDAGGAVISSSSQPLTVEAGATTPVTVTLTGRPAAGRGSVALTSRLAEVYDAQQDGQPSAGLDRGGAYSLTVTLRDADGQAILSPDLAGFTVCSSNLAFTLAGAGTVTLTLTASEPDSAAQGTTVFIPADGRCESQDGALASQGILVGGFDNFSTSMVSDRIVAGTGTVISGQLRTHLGSPLLVSGVHAEFSASSGGTFLPDSAATDSSGAFQATYTAPLDVTVPGEQPFLDVYLANQRHRFQYSVVARLVSAEHSSVTLDPASAVPGGSVVVRVTPRDVHDLPIYDAPTLTGTGGVSIGAPDVEGADNGERTFLFPVTVPASAGPVTFTATSGGVTVGTATLSVVSPLLVLDGTQPVGETYAFTSGDTKTFTLQETGDSGPYGVTASTASVSGNTLRVTPVSAGSAVLTVSDAHGQSVQFTVQVNTLDITVN